MSGAQIQLAPIERTPIQSKTLESTLNADELACAEIVLARSISWLELAVIGLNLCPFAKAVHVKRKICWTISKASDVDALLADLRIAMLTLNEVPIEQLETTLLIHPYILADFADYNEFLALADALIVELDLDGVLQIASFHPDYCFADANPQDLSNVTNRSPYPMLHLLREESISSAVAIYPDANEIVERNQATLARLGSAKWETLAKRFTQ